MFGDSGRQAPTEDGVLCAPAVATDPAAATVAVLRKFLRSMNTSIQEILIRTDASETAEIAKVIRRTQCRPLPIRSLENQSRDFSSQRIAFTTPPSTRSAAPLVAEESSLAT